MPRASEYRSLRERGLCTQHCGESTASSKCGVCRRKERDRAGGANTALRVHGSRAQAKAHEAMTLEARSHRDRG